MAELKIKFSDFYADPDTVLETPAVGDIVLIYDVSEPLDVNKVKAITYGNLVNLAAQSALQALVSGQAAGDMLYADTAASLARLAKGTAGQVLSMNAGATAPEWGGTIKDIDLIDVSPGQTFSNAAWEDITGATLTLTLPTTCTIFILASVTGYVNADLAGYSFNIRGSIDGNTDADNNYNGSANPKRNEAFPYFWYKTGITAGNKIVKLQCQQKTQNLYVTKARLIAFAFAE